ncbi:Protein daughter of sevenless [Gryllus bimaculatus]|nr:Protein daughter of sevenless [Gryllus bimaculatus]
MSNNSLEIVHEGWLTKSPPTKPVWRARWRRRWFVLRHSGELPGQYFLEYYTDRNCRKLKGKIDLDQCEQVDAGLRFETNKQKYQHMFDVKTPKRIYYLAAESEEEMNKWVEYVCHVCGLKAYKDDEDEYDYGGAGGEEEETAASVQAPLALPSGDNIDPALSTSTESPPVSPTSTISGPYIPISECISGKPLSTPNGLEDFNNIVRQGGYGSATNAQYGVSSNSVSTSQSWRATLKNNNHPSEPQKTAGAPVANQEEVPVNPLPAKTSQTKKQNKPGYEAYPLPHVSEFYDSPRKLHPPNLELSQGGNHTPPLHSPTTDAESVFTDDEWTAPVHAPPSVNWDTFPNPDSESAKQGRPSDSSADVELSTDIGSWSVKQRYGKYTIVDSALPTVHHARQPPVIPHPVAPPRPPKPLHLIEMPSHNYLNLENVSPKPIQTKPKTSAVSASSSVSESSKRSGGAPASPNDCASASECVEEPPSPGAAELIAIGSNDEMYDFPRSHHCANTVTISEPEGNNTNSKFGSLSRHCYSNAAPGQVNGDIFRYDFQHSQNNTNILVTNELEEPVSPHSEGSGSITSTNNVIYSNLPSPLSIQSASGVIEGNSGLPTPPAVNRGLKPGRKLSDSTSVVSSEPSPGGPFTSTLPPSVDRKLKPQRKYLEAPSVDLGGPIQLSSPPACRVGTDGTRSLRKTRAAPSPTPPSSVPAVLWNGQKQRSDRNSSSDEDHRISQDDEQIYYYQQENRFIPAGPGKRLQEIQYLDLDLDADASTSLTSGQIPKSPERVPTSGTVYKTVDFVKTQAFNRTRQKLEEERKLGPEL